MKRTSFTVTLRKLRVLPTTRAALRFIIAPGVLKVADNARRIADDYGVIRNRLGDHSSSAHHGTFADQYAWQDGRSTPDGSADFNGRHQKAGRVLFAPRIGVVGKSNVGADEDIVLYAQTVPEQSSRLYRNSIADDDIVLNEHVRANIAIGTDAGVREDDYELPDARIRTNVQGLYISHGVDLRCHMGLVFNELKDELAAR